MALLAGSLAYLVLGLEHLLTSMHRLFLVALAFVMLFLASLTFMVFMTLYRSIARPVEELSEKMQKLIDGDFEARVRSPARRSRNEIGSLLSNFNRMVERIQTMITELRQLDQLKSEFISTVSHELRTPLTSIGGYVKLIRAGDAGPVTDTQTEFLSIVETNVDRLTSLINDVLDVERMESGKLRLLREPQDLRSVLRECRDSLLLMAQQKGLELRLKLPETVGPVMGERSRLIQIFNNLISNAIKYTNSGFVEIELEPKSFAAVVRVRDSGIGMSTKEQEQLFEKFYRTDSGLASREKGTGLGLVITRGLVEAHGGTISVESETSQGSVFTVSLPLSAPVYSVEEITAEKAETEELLRALRDVDERSARSKEVRIPQALWIVGASSKESDRLRRLVEEGSPFLPGRNFTCRLFASVSEIPRLTTKEPAPAALIVDQGGIRSLSELRAKLGSNVPILVIGESVDSAVAFAEGASALLTKPIGERELWIAMQELLQSERFHVLVADANTDFRILLKRELEQQGFEVEDVDRGKLVLSRLEHERYDLLLMDLEFPDVSGVEILRALRKRSQFNRLPIFVMYDGAQKPPAQDEIDSDGLDIFLGKENGIEGITDRISRELLGETEEEGRLVPHPVG